MTATVRDMARALDDAALETLAPKGLVRRAAADVAAGRANIVSEDGLAADVQVDGETVHLLADGPRQGRCSCPAPGVCRHRLAALILLREPAVDTPASAEADDAGDDEHSLAPLIEAVDWAAVVAGFSPEALARFAGRSGWREAVAEFDRSDNALVTQQGSTLQVRLRSEAEPVIFLPNGGLDAALTKAPEKKREVKVVIAALAARQAFGLPTTFADPPLSPTTAAAATEPDRRTLEKVREVLRQAYGTALAFAPAALEAEIRRLALAGRVEAMPRLAASLRRLAGGFDPLRRRTAEADPDAMLELMAEIYALTVALERPLGEPGLDALIGQARQDYAPAGDLEVFGLGAKLWTTSSGAHGVTAYFHGPGRGDPFTLTQARADRTDVSFDPRAAFHSAPVWGEPMARLCAAQVRLRGTLVSRSRRLSTSQGVSAEVRPWTPSADNVRDWDCVHSDWRALELQLQNVLAGRLTAPAPAEAPVVLAFSRYAPVRFDELTQTLIWPLADRAGRWIGLTLPFEGVERHRIAVLERLAAHERFWAVLATGEVAGDGIELRPYALWGASQHLLDFSAAPTTTSKPADELAGLLARLKARIGAARSGPGGFVERRTHSDRLIENGWRLMLRDAEAGPSHSRDILTSEYQQMAREFGLAGLSALAGPFEALGQVGRSEDEHLRAAWAIITARRMRTRLAWMV
jgi:hypothetical protein